MYDVKDGLGIHYLTFRFDKNVICAGPFVIMGGMKRGQKNGIGCERIGDKTACLLIKFITADCL